MLKYLFESYFWVITVFFVISSSYLSAKVVSNGVKLFIPQGKFFAVKPKRVQLQEDDEQQRVLRASYTILDKANLFDKDQKPIVPPKKKAEKSEKKEEKKKKDYVSCDPKASYKRADLPLELKGTVVASDPDFSVAAVYDHKARALVVLRRGDVYRGIKICEIEQKYLKIDRGMGRYEYLELGAPPGKLKKSYNPALAYRQQIWKLRNTKLNLSQIKKVGKNSYSLPRSLIDDVSKRLNVIASQAAIVPYFHRGKPAGFRILHIKRGSIYEKLGIKNGDVIQRINGYEFTSPQKALEAYSNLINSDHLTVEVVRRGKRMVMEYKINE